MKTSQYCRSWHDCRTMNRLTEGGCKYAGTRRWKHIAPDVIERGLGTMNVLQWDSWENCDRQR